MNANSNGEQRVNLPSPEEVLGMIDQLHKTVYSLEG